MKPTRQNCQAGSTAVVKDELNSTYVKDMASISLMTDNGSLDLTPGRTVDIVAAPRIVNSGTAKVNVVSVRDRQTQQEGVFFWSDFIRYFKMETLVPGNDLPEPQENKLQRKREKLADPGYYVQYLIDQQGNLINLNNHSCSVICISPQANAKYVHGHHQTSQSWYTLLWSCAPSRKFMTTTNQHPTIQGRADQGQRYVFFATWQELIANCQLTMPEVCRRERAPNDTFSPP